MNKSITRLLASSVVLTALFSTGCTSGIPWQKKQVAQQVTAEQYAQQAAANIQYNTSDVDVTEDYQSTSQAIPSYTSPPKVSSVSSSDSGSCSSGCCH